MMIKIKDRIRAWWMRWVEKVEDARRARVYRQSEVLATRCCINVTLVERNPDSRPVRVVGGPEGIHFAP